MCEMPARLQRQQAVLEYTTRLGVPHAVQTQRAEYLPILCEFKRQMPHMQNRVQLAHTVLGSSS